MKKIILLFIAMLLLSVTSLYSQGILNGYVSEKVDGNKLEGVNIFINELQRGAVTNPEGHYSFSSLPFGRYHIQFSFVGFKPQIFLIDINKSQVNLNVEMVPANINIGDILVLGNAIRPKEKLPYKIETISKSQLEENGFLTVTKSLSLLPGVSELSNGAGISKPVIRGLFGYRIASVIDGLRIDNQQWQNEHDFGLNDVGAERIEIIEGPASLLYGSQALGGVIKIDNEKNAPMNTVLGNYNLKIFSNTLGASTEIGLKGTKEKFSWQLHVNGQSQADYLQGGGEKVPNTRFASLGAAGLLSYNFSWGISSLNYNFLHQINGIVEEADLTNLKDLNEDHFEREFEGPHHIVDYHIAALRNTILLGTSMLKINLGFQNNHRVEDEGTEKMTVSTAADSELDVILNTFSADAQWIKSFTENTELTLGAQGFFQSNENDGMRILIPNADTRELSLYSYLKQSFGKVDIDAGLRFDSKNIDTKEMGIKDSASYFTPVNEDFQVFNGAIGAAFNATENLTFKLNVASGYRAPNLAELTSNGVHEGTTRYEIGDASLKSEQSIQTDFGINFQAKDVNLNLSLFYNAVNNFVFLQPTNEYRADNRIYRFMQANANLKGGEVSVDWNLLEWLNIGSSYSTVIGKKSDDSYLPFMPADKIITKAKLHWNELSSLKNFYFMLMLRSYLKQDKIAAEEIATPAYTLFDAGVGSTVKLFDLNFNVAINVTNLLDKKYYDHLSLLKSLGVYDMGRNISLALDVPFNL